MAATAGLPDAVRRFVRAQPHEVAEIMLALRQIVLDLAPHAAEKVCWNSINLYDASLGGIVKGAICQITADLDHVRLGFIQGALMPDPHKLLEGKGKFKRNAHIRTLKRARSAKVRRLIIDALKTRPWDPEA